jgi:hypothetical protein
MPNWLYIEVHIDGPIDEIARFRAAHIREDDGKVKLDFNSIIPKPPELNDTECGGYTDVLIWALGGELYAKQNLLRKLGMQSADDTPLDWPWLRERGIASREELFRWAEKEIPDKLDTARRILEIEHSAGYRSWYDWQVENWGCKSGCYEFMRLPDDNAVFCRDTPRPIVDKLVELYPALTFTYHLVEADNDRQLCRDLHRIGGGLSNSCSIGPLDRSDMAARPSASTRKRLISA